MDGVREDYYATYLEIINNLENGKGGVEHERRRSAAELCEHVWFNRRNALAHRAAWRRRRQVPRVGRGGLSS